MGEFAAAPPASLTGMWCPRCGERALDAARDAPKPAHVVCMACGAEHEALADVTVLDDHVRRVGGCCAGFFRHELHWLDRSDHMGTTRFETWVQDHVLLRPGDRASLLFLPGDLEQPRKSLPMPLSAANHTLGAAWALPGSCAIERLV